MSEEQTIEDVKTENVPQLRKAGRTRNRPQSDYKALAEQQGEMLKNLQAQNERLMGMIVGGQVGSGNPLQMFLPPKPQPIPRPDGFRFALKKIQEGENDDQAIHMRDVPSRTDNPNEPDPRYCVFCKQNVVALYGHTNITGAPTPEQQPLIEQCFLMHQQDAMAKASLEGSKYEVQRRYAADHLGMTATRWGRVPDVVANYMGREWSSAEWYERQVQEWEAKCRAVGLGMAQGGK